MDPLSQAVLGSLFSGFAAPKNKIRKAIGLGALAGMASDLDVLIQSAQDPLLAIQFHRHFTHSLLFVPVGALLCAVVLHKLFKLPTFKETYLYCFLGFLSHGLLDACTSYGTQLFWPFSNMRVAWDWISIIDPLYTLPLLALILLAYVKTNLKWIHTASFYSVFYMCFAVFQHYRALNLLAATIQSRGHSAERMHAKPSIGALVLHRGLYEYNHQFYVVGLRTPYFGKAKILDEGGVVQKYVVPPEQDQSVLAQDIRRFAWFSDNYLAWHPTQNNTLVDIRYSILPNRMDPLWGIEVDFTQPQKHTPFVTWRAANAETRKKYFDLLIGEGS